MTASKPAHGSPITMGAGNKLNVPDQPIIPYIEGDGTGVDITPVMIKVVDAAVAKAYGGRRKIHWMETFAGEKSTKVYGADVWLPKGTFAPAELLERVRIALIRKRGPKRSTPPPGGSSRIAS